MLQPKSSKTLSPLHFAVEETVSLVIKGAQNYYIGAVSSHFLCRRCALSCQPFFCPVCLGLAIGVACTMQSTGVLGYLLNLVLWLYSSVFHLFPVYSFQRCLCVFRRICHSTPQVPQQQTWDAQPTRYKMVTQGKLNSRSCGYLPASPSI